MFETAKCHIVQILIACQRHHQHIISAFDRNPEFPAAEGIPCTFHFTVCLLQDIDNISTFHSLRALKV